MYSTAGANMPKGIAGGTSIEEGRISVEGIVSAPSS
jgi:hypothetical protein